MSIGRAITELENTSSKCTNEEQKTFLDNLIEQLKPHVRKPVVSHGNYDDILDEKLEDLKKILGREPDKNEIESLIDQVASQIPDQLTYPSSLNDIKLEIIQKLKQTSPDNLRFKDTLKNCLNSIDAVVKKLKNPEEITKDIPAAKLTELNLIAEELYRQTPKYGDLILPLNQGTDPRMGNSLGECFGYVAAWAEDFANGNKPFGIDPQTAPLFKPVSPHILKKLIDANHLIPINYKITQLQNSQHKSPTKGDQDAWNLESTLFFNPDSIADNLIKTAAKNSQKTYMLFLGNGIDSHATGFKKDDHGYYHFLDSNVGWFRFANAENFKNWFSIYYDASSEIYQHFFQYKISEYQSLDEKNVLNPQNIFIRTAKRMVNNLLDYPLSVARYADLFKSIANELEEKLFGAKQISSESTNISSALHKPQITSKSSYQQMREKLNPINKKHETQHNKALDLAEPNYSTDGYLHLDKNNKLEIIETKKNQSPQNNDVPVNPTTLSLEPTPAVKTNLQALDLAEPNYSKTKSAPSYTPQLTP